MTPRLALVALPWSVADRPSAALASLAPFVRNECSGWVVDCHYAYMDVAVAMGMPLYFQLAEQAMQLGEVVHAGLFYPERRAAVRDRLAGVLRDELKLDLADTHHFPEAAFGSAPTYDAIGERVLAIVEAHLQATVERLAGYGLVGLTTCFGQLYANLYVARALKARDATMRVLLGGSSVSSAVGPSLLKEYGFLDYIIQGEGELPLVALIRAIEAGDPGAPPGVLSRRNVALNPGGVSLSEVLNLDALPIPDYSGYAEQADAANVVWTLPVEGSRGCWWDRGKRTGDPRNTCYFCNLNVQWKGYRQKSVARLAQEIDELSTLYANPLLFFLDNIVRLKGIEELSTLLQSHGKDYLTFYEMRAHMSPYEILCMWDMGLRWSQFGIEGLSSKYLKRVGKGTSCIQNLQAMRTCYELGIDNGANLVVNFPGSTDEEVEENRANILQYGILYQPLRVVGFEIGIGSTVEQLREAFGVTDVRNADFWKVGLPDEVYRRMVMFNKSAEFPTADWTPVREAVEIWKAAHAAAHATEYQHVMTYADGGTFLKIVDGRTGSPLNYVLRGTEREVYLHCMEIATRDELIARFTDGSEPSKAALTESLDRMTAQMLMFSENDKYLSLAPAPYPDLAARRIRAAHARELARRTTPDRDRPKPLLPPVLPPDAAVSVS
jgi:ribosomal peptide maturation radical SAM protein 1